MTAPSAQNETHPDSDDGRYALFDQLAAEYAERWRRGERPELSEFIARHPKLADEIRDLFPAMVAIERADDDPHSGHETTPLATTPIPNQVGDYRILREIGRGGMGVVYEAEQLSLGRHVALKVMLGAWARAGSLERFRREARAAARLHHTNIVPVFDVGQDRDVAYYAMQFIQGQGLDLVIDELRLLRRRSRGAARALDPPLEDAAGRSDAPIGGPTREIDDVADAGSRWQQRGAVSRIAHGLLTGLLTAEESGLPETEHAFFPAVDRIGAGAGPGPDVAVAERPSASAPAGDAGAESSSSAVLPGGAPISSSDAHGRRTAFYRSVAQLGRQVAEALHYAHARGIVHRDIKPSNLLLDTTGVVWITDFGLAKGLGDALTHTGDILGTIRYMAPERFRGEGDARADIYALGITLYELLTLQPAFGSSDRLGLMEKIKNEEPAQLRAIEGRIPRDLETIVLKAMEKEPKRRYASAGAMADDLRRFYDGEPIQARAVSQVERVIKWMRRRPYVAASLALIGALTVFLAIVLIRSNIQITQALGEARFQQRKAEISEAAERAARATAEAERAKAATAALGARRQAARVTAREGQSEAESGAIEQGLFKLAEALELLPDETPRDHKTRQALGRSLAAWQAVHPVIRHVLDDVLYANFLGDDGMTLAVFRESGVTLLDLMTGREVDDRRITAFTKKIKVLSPDLSLLCVDDPQAGKIFYDRATWQIRAKLPSPNAWFHHDPSRQFGPGNRYFIFPLQEKDRATIRIERLDGLRGPVGPVRVVPLGARILDYHCCLLPAVGGHTVLAELPIEGSAGGRPPGRVRFWDLDLGSEIGRVHIEPGAQGRGWSFDGKSLVTTLQNGLVSWWDPATGERVRPAWRPDRAAYAATLCDGGRLLAVGCDDRRIRWFDPVRKAQRGPSVWVPMGSIQHVEIAPGGMFFLAQSNHRAGVWQFSWPLEAAPSSHSETPRVRYDLIDFHRDRPAYALGQPPLDGVRLNWPSPASPQGKLRERLGVTGALSIGPAPLPVGPPLYPWTRFPTYSPDGRLIAAARSQWARHGVAQTSMVGIWDAQTGQPVTPLKELRDWVHSIAFSADGRTLAVGIVPGIELFDVPTGRHRAFLVQPGPISRLAFRPDGRILAAGTRFGWASTPGVRLWDLATTRPAGPLFQGAVLPFFWFEPDGRSLVTLDIETRRLTHLDGATGVPLAPSLELEERRESDTISSEGRVQAYDQWRLSYRSVAIAVRPDGRVLAEAARSAVVQQWEVLDGRPSGPALVHPGPVMALAYSPDGSTLATGSFDGTVRLWDTAMGQLVGPALPHGEPILAMTFSADGSRLIVVTRDGRCTTWPMPGWPSAAAPERVRDWVEASLGFRSGDDGALVGLSAAGWHARLERLAAAGSPVSAGGSAREMSIAWHRSRALELERLGEYEPSSRHWEAVSRMVKGDWVAGAHRAVVQGALGRFDALEAEYARVAQVAPPNALVDWYWREALSCLDAGGNDRSEPSELQRALWYLDKVIAARPDDWRPWYHRSEIFDRLGQHERRQADEDAALARGAGPLFAIDFTADAVAHGRFQRARQILSDYSDRLDQEDDGAPGELQGLRAFLLAHVGDRSGHERLCRRLLAKLDLRSFPQVVTVADACTARSTPPDVAAQAAVPLTALLGRASAARRRIVLSRQGAILYRAGRPSEAIRSLEETVSQRFDVSPEDLAFLAMAHQSIGQVARARDRLALFEAACQRLSRGGDFWTRISCDDLLKEARAKILLDPVFPANPFAGD